MEEDILDSLLNSSEPAFKPETSTTSTPTKANGREDLWEAKDFKKVKPDVSKFKKEGKSFILMVAATPPEDMQKRLNAIITALAKKNYTLRYQVDTLEHYTNTAVAIDGLSVESYLPWKKLAPELKYTKAYAERPAYEHAFYYAQKFLSFPPAVRCKRANLMYAILGTKLNNPIDLALIWSECGSETINKDIDFKKIGNLGSLLPVCKDLDIPVFNVQKDDSFQKLVEIVKSA